MITADYRYDLDLEFRWLNPPPQEMINKWHLYERLKKKSENLTHSDETFRSQEADKSDKF